MNRRTLGVALAASFLAGCTLDRPLVAFVAPRGNWTQTGLSLIPDSDQLITNTDQVLHAVGLTASDEEVNYDVMYGPQASGSTNTGQVKQVFDPDDGSPCLWVGPQAGAAASGDTVAFFVGKRPRAVSKWIKGTANSTQFVVQVERSGANEINRVYLLSDGDDVVVHVKSDPPTAPDAELAFNKYFELVVVASTGVEVSRSNNNAITGAQALMINDLKARASTKHLRYP